MKGRSGSQLEVQGYAIGINIVYEAFQTVLKAEMHACTAAMLLADCAAEQP
jgi:hypothetical protein